MISAFGMQQLAKDKERETRLCVVRGGGGGVAEGLRSRHQAVLFFCSIAKEDKKYVRQMILWLRVSDET